MITNSRRVVVVVVVDPGCDNCGGRTGGRRGRWIIAAHAPRPEPNPLHALHLWLDDKSRSCLGGRGSLPSLIVLDDDLDDASPSWSSSSSSTVESILACSLLRYRPADDEDHKDDDHGEAAAPRGPGASVLRK